MRGNSSHLVYNLLLNAYNMKACEIFRNIVRKKFLLVLCWIHTCHAFQIRNLEWHEKMSHLVTVSSKKKNLFWRRKWKIYLWFFPRKLLGEKLQHDDMYVSDEIQRRFSDATFKKKNLHHKLRGRKKNARNKSSSFITTLTTDESTEVWIKIMKFVCCSKLLENVT